MTFIDWSDSEGILELLSEFVRDELKECANDPKRKEFLSHVLSEVDHILREFGNTKDAANHLGGIYNSIEKEFQNDSVTVHISDCIRELHRLE
jgi:hypothetical protein